MNLNLPEKKLPHGQNKDRIFGNVFLLNFAIFLFPNGSGSVSDRSVLNQTGFERVECEHKANKHKLGTESSAVTSLVSDGLYTNGSRFAAFVQFNKYQ